MERDKSFYSRKLKSCPFCGGKAKIVCIYDTKCEDEFERMVSIGCVECGISTQFMFMDDAVLLWNERMV